MSSPPNREVTLFSAALELPATERAAYLAEACADDPALRLRLEALLRVHEDAITFLEHQAPGAPEGTGRPDATVRIIAAPSEKAGDRIGRYKLLQQIGEGGCGVVYMAEQEEPIRRRVALKVIKLGMDTRQVIARFEAERQALALMDHPNIAKVLDAGATDTGRPYFVMELVRGIRITDYCDQNKLSTKERLTLFMQVCRAVQHAHQKGIIHRDLKPSNILVASNDGVPVPKVIDFGIAKATQGRLTDQTVFTAFEQFIGTPAYMSPEQAEMTMLDIDTRTDIYALGVLLYELLTGRTPFDTKELLAAGLDEMRRTIREVEPVKPSTRLTQERVAARAAGSVKSEILNPKSEIAQDLDWIVMKCLEKDRARRYETANGLAVDIARHVNNEPVLARPPSNLYRLQKLARRNKVFFAASGAVAAALMIGLVVSSVLLFQERAARRRAVAAEGKSQTEASKSQQVAQFLKTMIESIGPSVALGRDTALVREVLDRTAERVGTDLTNQPEVELEVRSTLANTYHELGLYREMETMARRRLELARETDGEQNGRFARALTSLADAQMHLGKLEESEKLTHPALALHRKLWAQDPTPASASLLGLLAHIFSQGGNLAEAEKLYREVLALQKKLLGNESAAVAGTLVNLGGVLEGRHRLDEAEKMQIEGLAMRRRLYGNEHPDVANSLHNLGTLFFDQWKLSQAEAMHREALAMRQKLLDKEHPSIANSLHNLAVVLCREGNLAEAETLERQALAMRRKLFGNEHRDVMRSLENLAQVLSDLGKLPEVETLNRELRELLATWRQRLSNEHPDELVRTLVTTADILAREGKLPEAETTFRELLSVLRTTSADQPSPDTPLLGSVLHHLADLRRRQKALVEARALATDAVALYERHPDWAADERQHAVQVLGFVLKDLGDFDAPVRLMRAELSRARQLSTNAPSEEASSLGTALYYLATLLRERKALAEARSLAEEANDLYQRNPAWSERKRQYAVATLRVVLRDLEDFAALEALMRADLTRLRILSTNTPAQESPGLGVAVYELANVLRERKTLEEARSLAQEAIALYNRHPDWPSQKRQYAVELLGDVLTDSGDFAAREALLREELSRAQKLSTNDASGELPILGVALHHLAEALQERKALEQARTLAEEAAAMYKRHPDWPSKERQHAVTVLANVLTELRNFTELEPLFREELSRARELSTNDASGETSHLAQALCHLAATLRNRKALAEAQSLAEEAVAMYGRHPDWPSNQRQQAVAVFRELLWDREDFIRLDPLLRQELTRARELSTNAPSGETSSLGVALYQLVEVLRKRKSLAEAQSLGEEAAAMYRRYPDWPPNQRQNAFVLLGKVRTDMGDPSGAEAVYREQLQTMRARLAADDPELGDVIALLTSTLLEQEKFAQAEPLARECLDIREKKDPDDWLTFNARSMLMGGALLGQKKYADAEPLLLSGYEGMQQREDRIPPAGKVRLKQALQRLAQLYEATNRSDEAARWKTKLADFDRAEAEKKPSVSEP